MMLAVRLVVFVVLWEQAAGLEDVVACNVRGVLPGPHTLGKQRRRFGKAKRMGSLRKSAGGTGGCREACPDGTAKSAVSA